MVVVLKRLFLFSWFDCMLSYGLSYSPTHRRSKRLVLPNVNDGLQIQRLQRDATSVIFHLQQRLNINNTGETFMSRSNNNVLHAANGSVLRLICLLMNMRSIAKKCDIFVHIVRWGSTSKATWLNMNAKFIEKKDVLLVQFASRHLQLNEIFCDMRTLFIAV